MPPSSRKRNKGKERKAKQQAKKEEYDRADAHRCWQSFYSSIGCTHGCDVAISDDNHPVSIFMDQFFINAKHKIMNVRQNLTNLFETHRLIWSNESYRRLALNILIRIGTNMLLQEEEWCEISWPVCIAHSIVVLEHYDGTDDIDSVINSRVVCSKNRDLVGTSSCKRDALKFYRKRTTCKCLKKMHLEARKTIPKMGFCWGCDKEMERVALSVCGRCMVQQYCSRECQVAHWSSHEALCNTTRKQVRARTDI